VNVLSLFDGMSCGRLALERAGFPISNYFASEIDKYAIEVARANYPDTVHLGDVTGVKTHKNGDLFVPLDRGHKIDLLIGGSPCQGFSWAGKRLNFDDPRSALFFEYVRLFRELKPTWFLLENVNMKQEHQDVITEHLGVKPVRINSNLVSAQNRDRLYWTNIPVRSMPENKRVYLKDILENGFTDRDKSHCIDANYFKGGNLKSYFQKNRRQLVFDFADDNDLLLAGEADLKGHGYNRRVYHPDGKAPTLCANSGGNLEPKILVVGEAEGSGFYQDRKVVSPEGKSPTLTGQRASNVPKILQVPRGNNKGGVKGEDGKVPTLSGSSWEHNNFVTDGMTWRKLTPIECERLQTVPDGYTDHVSNTQRYRMLGNGWTVDVICHLLKGMKDVAHQ
tara:strand:+ start:5118 stop:6296 length:1179 start_codon:yes stop_codon:yes gene_type:complete